MSARIAFYITVIFACAGLDALLRHDRETLSDLKGFLQGWLTCIWVLIQGDYDV